MKIVVLLASPNVHGSTKMLAKNFADGAQEAQNIADDTPEPTS